jgi:putative oxidoreductase
MQVFQTFNAVRIKYYAELLAALRIILGIALLYKGIQFVKNDALLTTIIANEEGVKQFIWLHQLIPFAHLLSGVFITIGYYTKWMAMSQIPILIGAIFFIYTDKRAYLSTIELPFAVIILVLVTLFSIKGDGIYSIKSLIKKEKDLV